MTRNKMNYEFTEEEEERLFQERCDSESQFPETEEQMRIAAERASIIFGGDAEEIYQGFKKSKRKRMPQTD